MHARSLPNGMMLAPPKPSFWLSWRVVAIYVCLIVWTPIVPMRPLPPFRLDDFWLIFWIIMQFVSRSRLSPATSYFPFWGLLALGMSFALSTFLASDTLLQFTDISDSFKYFRLALILWVIAPMNLMPKDVFKLFITFTIACFLIYPIFYVQEQGINPWAAWSIKIWTTGDRWFQQYRNLRIQRRAIGTIGNPNYAGFFVWGNAAVCVALLAIRNSTKSLFIKAILLANAIISLPVILFLLKSRSAFVCFVIAVVYCTVGIIKINRNTRMLRTVIVLGVLLGVFTVFFFQIRESLPKRMAAFLGASSSDRMETMDPRFYYWNIALNELSQHDRFVFGFGATNVRVVDSGYLTTLYRQGLFGMPLFIGVWLWGIGRATMGWLFGNRDPAEQYVFLIVGLLIFGSMFFEMTAEGFISYKMGPILMIAFGLLQKPIRIKNRPSRPGVIARPMRA